MMALPIKGLKVCGRKNELTVAHLLDATLRSVTFAHSAPTLAMSVVMVRRKISG